MPVQSHLPSGWTKHPHDPRRLDGPGGCRVCAEWAPLGRWRFAAWGPDRSAGWNYRKWCDGTTPHWSGEEPRVHYARGESIPQPAVLYGFFDSAADARAACEAAYAG